MVKILASILIIFSCSAFGFIKASEIYGRIKFLDNVKRMFTHLRGEINYAKTPMMEAFYSIAQKEEGILRDFCIGLADEIGKMEGKSFSDIWMEITDRNLSKSPMDKSDLEEFRSIGDKLGFQDYEMQIAVVDIELEYLEEKINNLKVEVFQKQKVYRALGVFSGLMITILLI